MVNLELACDELHVS